MHAEVLKAFYHDHANPHIFAVNEADFGIKNFFIVLKSAHLGGCLVARLSSSSILETLQVYCRATALVIFKCRL